MIIARLIYRYKALACSDLDFEFKNMKSSKDFNRMYGQLLVFELKKIAELIKKRDELLRDVCIEGVKKQKQDHTEAVETEIAGIKTKNPLWFMSKSARNQIQEVKEQNREVLLNDSLNLHFLEANWTHNRRARMEARTKEYKDLLLDLGFDSVLENFDGVTYWEEFFSSGADRDLLYKAQKTREHLESYIAQSVTTLKRRYGIYEEEQEVQDSY